MIEIQVINLEERKDRWEYTQKLFRGFNLKRFEAIKMNPGWKGCALSHISLIKKAKEEGKDFVVIAEDDIALFEPIYFKEKFEKIIKYLEENLDKWDIYQFGTTYSEVGRNDNVHWINKELNIIEYQFGLTTSFIIYNKSVYDKMISVSDTMSIEKQDAIDVKMNSFGVRQWTTIPFLSYQRDDYSNIQNNHMKYRHYFEANQNYLKNKIR